MKQTILLDFSGLTENEKYTGQFRYAQTLFAELLKRRPQFRYVVLIANQEVGEILKKNILILADSAFVIFPSHKTKIGWAINQIKYLFLAVKYRVGIWHTIASQPPLLVPMPLVITCYDLMFEMFNEYSEIRRSLEYKTDRFAFKSRAAKIIAISCQTKKDLIKFYGIPEKKIEVVYLGSYFGEMAESASVLDVTAKRDYPEKFILSYFNLEPRKNLMALLEAFQVLSQKDPKLKLVLFGKAAWNQQRESIYQDRIVKLGISDKIVHTDIADDYQLTVLYKHCLCFVYPSFYEGFGLPIAEAMACGACVIAKSNSSMEEIIGDAGVLVEQCDRDSLVKAVLSSMDSTVKQDVSKNAKQRAALFSNQKMADGTAQVYAELLRCGLPEQKS